MGCGASQPPLFAPIEQGDKSKVRDIIRAKPNSAEERSKTGDSPLHHACQCEPGDEAQCVEALLEGGAPYNATNSAGFTPLHVAACSGKAGAFKKVCAAGGKIEAVEPSGQTPLHLAAQHGHASCVQAAVDCGVAINTPNKQGETMLHTAAAKGMEECVTVAVTTLAESGPGKSLVDLNIQSADGRTPLHMAAASGSKAIVQALVKAGADKSIRDNNGKLPMEHTQDRAIAEMLQVVIMEENMGGGNANASMPELPAEDESFKPVDDSTRKRIQDLVNSTWKSATTRDRGFEKVSEFEVVQVLENRNTELMAAYKQRREEVALHLVNKLTDVKTAGDFDAGLEEARQSNANEFYLFHGTKPSAAKDICQNNFRVDLSGSNKGMLYGPGVYLAEASSKADEYGGDDKDGLYRGLYAMLLCRATLGNPVITEEVTPDVDALGEKLSADEFHCIVGDREKAKGTYREFIVRDKRQVYPAYAIIYRRKES